MKQDVEQTKAVYDGQVKDRTYDTRGGSTNRDAVLKLLDKHWAGIARVIDVGCGDGAVVESILRAPGNDVKLCLGVEATPALAKLARGRAAAFPYVLIEERDARDLKDLEGSGFDLGLCLFVLQDMSAAEGRDLLTWYKRALRKGGLPLVGLSVDQRGPSRYVHGRGKLTYTWAESDLQNVFSALGFRRVDFQGQPRGNLLEGYWLLQL